MKKQKVYIPTTDKEGFTHIISDPSKNEICGAREVEGYLFDSDLNVNNIGLLPCPLCNGNAELKRFGNEHTKKRSAEIECRSCNLKLTVGAIRNDLEWCQKIVTDKWNKRLNHLI